MIERAVTFFQRDTLLWGPILLLATLAIGVKTQIPFDLLFLALSGFYLSARWQIKGCYYALALLFASAALKHAFFISDHLWHLGVEGSLACGFLITALAFEQGAHLLETLTSQIETRKAALENLEEELARTKEASQEQQIAFQEKVALLQKELEELQSDHSSILILNEVLRKTTARHIQEAENLSSKFAQAQLQLSQCQAEYKECQKDLLRLSQTQELALQNKQLFKELNEARYQKEQTHLINETLARLYARESLRAKDADQEAAHLGEQLLFARKEAERIALPLQEQLAASRQEIATLKFEFEKANIEANQARASLLKLNEIQMERNFLRERLQAALEEIELLQRQKPKQQDPELIEQLKFAQQKMVHLAQIEPLFKQLKKQFEEKNAVLHQARSELFQTNTELEKIRIEKGALELSPLPKEIERELQLLAEKVEELETENQELEELITLLTEPSSDASQRKKKVKMKHSPEQEFLF